VSGRRRVVLAAALVVVAAAAVVLGAVGRDPPSSPALGIDWSDPAPLPPVERTELRSELVSDERGYRFWPRSGRVRPSVAYRFDTGHCGLEFLTDFDGSFWRPADPADGEPPTFLANQDVGAIALVDFDTAVYRGSNGLEVELRRIRGPVVTQPCD
jgi:hypothetical protein